MALTLADASANQGHTSSSTTNNILGAAYYTGGYYDIGTLLVAVITVTSNNKTLSSFTTPSGWTLLTSSSIANYNYMYVMYKVVTTSTDNGSFTAVVHSATAQVCSYGVTTASYTGAGAGSSILSAFQTTAGNTMSATLTAPASSQVIVMYADTTNPSILTFGGTTPTYSGGGTVDIENNDNSGVHSYQNVSFGTVGTPGSGTAVANCADNRTHPVFGYLLIPSGTISYTENCVDTLSSFSESQITQQAVLQAIAQANSFIDSPAQAARRIASSSDTVTTFGDSVKTFQNITNNPTQVMSFASTPTQHLAALAASADTNVSFSDSNLALKATLTAVAQTLVSFSESKAALLAKQTFVADQVVNFSEAKSALIHNFTNASAVVVTFSESRSPIIAAITATNDAAIAFLDAVQNQTYYRNSIAQRAVSFAEAILSLHPILTSVSDTVATFSEASSAVVIRGSGAPRTYIFTNADRSGTIGTANTAQQLMLANSIRAFWRIQNRSKYRLYINDSGGTASANPANGSFVLLPGASYWSQAFSNTGSAISILGTVVNQAFVATETNATSSGGDTDLSLGIVLTNISGSIAAANTSQPLQTASADICYLRVQNLSTKSLWITNSGTATPNGAGCYEIRPLANIETPIGGASNAAYNICGSAGVTGQYFSAVVGILAGQAVTVTDHSSTITVGGSTQQLMPANTARKGWKIQNLSQYDMWYNDTGGIASPNVLGSYRIRPRAYVEFSQNNSSTNAITIYCIHTGAQYSAGDW